MFYVSLAPSFSFQDLPIPSFLHISSLDPRSSFSYTSVLCFRSDPLSSRYTLFCPNFILPIPRKGHPAFFFRAPKNSRRPVFEGWLTKKKNFVCIFFFIHMFFIQMLCIFVLLIYIYIYIYIYIKRERERERERER